MTARLCLVGLVVGFGFEPPEAANPSMWLEAGREWAQVRLAELDARRISSEAASIVEPSSEDDLSFATLMDEIASELEEDAIGSAEASPVDSPVELFGSHVVPSPIVADGSCELPESVWQDFNEPVADNPVVVSEAPRAKSQPRSERLTEAIRLTEQALKAWLSVVVVDGKNSLASH